MRFGSGVVKSWAKTLASISLSVAEAEFYAGVKGGAVGICYCNLLRDLGIEAKVVLWTDSSTAKAMAARTGAGKARHIDTRFHWIQDVIKRGVVTLRKILGDRNPADLMTKPQGVQKIRKRAGVVGVRITEFSENSLEEQEDFEKE